MAVFAFDEDDGQEGGWDQNGATRTRLFKCKVSEALGAEDDLYAYRRDLQYGQRHPRNSSLFVSNWQARQTARGRNHQGHYLFGVTVTYATPSGELEQSPLDLPADITLATEQYEGLTCYDDEGEPILNSAGDLVYLPKESSRWIFNVTKNLPAVPAWLLDYNNAVNNGLVSVKGLSCSKETLMCKNVNAGKDETVKVNGRFVTFVPFSYQLHYQAEGWKGKHPNVGFNEKLEVEIPQESDTVIGKILVVEGKVKTKKQVVKRRIKIGFPAEYPTEPQPLDSKGRVIKNATAKDILQIEAGVYKKKNFGQLPLR